MRGSEPASESSELQGAAGQADLRAVVEKLNFYRAEIKHEFGLLVFLARNRGPEQPAQFCQDFRAFRTYFKFQLSPSGKIRRLDIGQAT